MMESIDVAKFIGSVLIFSMHCNALGDYRYAGFALELSARWGVPFFFICSAFFLFSKKDLTKEVLKKYIYRIASLYLVWFVLNIPNIIYYRLYSKDLSAVGTWLVFFKNAVLSSTFTGSWYLASSIFSAWFVYLLSRRIDTKTIVLLSVVLYLPCVFTSAYYGVLPAGVAEVLGFICFPRNIFTGCLCFSLGKYIAENREKMLKVFTKRRSALLFVVFYALFIAEIIMTKHFDVYKSTDFAFSLPGAALSLFIFCIQTDCPVYSKNTSVLLRKLSTVIYCCQGNVLLLNIFLKSRLHFSSVVSYIISAAAVVVILFAVIVVQRTTQWKWAKNLT